MYRCDRSLNTSDKNSGGGVLISVNRKYKSELVKSGDNDGCEQVWVQLNFKNRKILLGVLQIPPNSCNVIYERHMKMIDKMCNNVDMDTSIFSYGDFNLPLLQWIQSDVIENTYIPFIVSNQFEESVIDSCSELRLYQMKGVLNDNGRILDLFWTVCDINHIWIVQLFANLSNNQWQ